jgi:hypothetical protein
MLGCIRTEFVLPDRPTRSGPVRQDNIFSRF